MIDMNKVGTRLGNPEEIPEPLRGGILEFRDTQARNTLEILNMLGGIASLSEIIVHLYRKYGLTVERNYFLTRVIYGLIRKGLVRNFAGKPGIYCLSTFKG